MSQELWQTANSLRAEAIRMIYEGGEGHPGPALSIADIVAALYFEIMNLRPQQPDWEDRDRLILSKGHACPILYAALSRKGYLGQPVQDYRLRQLHSPFQGHPVLGKTPGVDMTSGSLGNGIAVGAGMAWAGKRRGKDYRVFVITGDGELQEGVNWEGINLAAAHKLDNLTVFVDRNGWQSGDRVEAIIGSNNIAERFAAFGWDTREIDGHNHAAIVGAVNQAGRVSGKPSVIVCDCVKGKGVPYMENDNSWHKATITPEQYETAIQALGGARS